MFENIHNCQHIAIDCEVIVASAAPRMPQRNHHTKVTTSTMFIPTVKSTEYMACFGLPTALSTAFMPKYMWVIILPKRITIINSRAYGSVTSDAPKKRNIGSRNVRETNINRKPITRLSVTVLPNRCSAVW